MGNACALDTINPFCPIIRMQAKGKTHAKGKARLAHEKSLAKDKGEASVKDHTLPPLDTEGREICFLFLKYGKCRYGKKCKKSHNPPDPSAHLQKMTPVALVQPEPSKEEPKLTFSISRTPYSKPGQHPPPSTISGAAWTESPGRLVPRVQPKPMRTFQKKQANGILPSSSTQIQDSTTVSKENMEPKKTGNQLDSIVTDTSQSIIPDETENISETPKVQPVIAMPPPRPKKKTKVPSKQLLAALFKTLVSPEQLKQYRKHKSAAQDAKREHHGHSKVSNKSNTLSSKYQRSLHKMAPKTALPPSSSFESNSTSISGEKIEQWYITNKAQLEPVSKRLVILKKPATSRQKSLLKTMRRHHWECKTAVEQLLDRDQPTSFALKIARDRIDWGKLGPYIALMLQAAFAKDLGDPHLPIVAATLCGQLQHKNISGLECENLLMSWGLTHINARRFSNHIWEMMVAAAGDSNIHDEDNFRGVGYQIRQMQSKKEYQDLQERMSVLYNKPV